VLGVVAGILPWFFFPSRTMFFFYALPALPFLVLALTLTIGLVVGKAGATPARRAAGASIAGAYLLLVIANFGYMYPVFVAEVIPYTDWMHHMWFDSWI
jgi:dolichyl-phosphate-mannose--protein O-mannosyl transferase